jgi:E3 ubiquitin-protein ligase TRIP12
VARSVLDDRRIDVPFHPVFLQLVMDPHYVVDTADIKSIDETLGRSMEFLSNYAHRFAELMQLNDTKDIQQEELEAQLQQLEKHVEALALDFSLPGVPGYQLMEHETLVTIFNLQHYLDLLRDALVGKGIETQVTSFRRGFNTIFPVERMRLFTPLELAQMLGDQHDDSEHWTLSALYDTIHADHGYTLDSPSIHHLLGILTAFASEERRMFLLFITGSPRLPHGGFKKLVPKLTIVRKLPDYPLTADAYLPSVMTCANYLKLPDYSSQHVMRLKLVQAMHDGQSSFHLS